MRAVQRSIRSTYLNRRIGYLVGQGGRGAVATVATEKLISTVLSTSEIGLPKSLSTAAVGYATTDVANFHYVSANGKKSSNKEFKAVRAGPRGKRKIRSGF